MTAGVDQSSPPWLDVVRACYDEPHRRYHDQAHVRRVLVDCHRLLREVAVDDGHAVILAAWFHDAVYDPRSSTNEADSGDLAAALLAGTEGTARIAAVRRLILATATHQPVAPDEAVLVDADLAILGADPSTYAVYVVGVRAEYAFVDDHAWRTGRARVLRSFLDRRRIFSTPAMASAEAAARANLTDELTQLTDL